MPPETGPQLLELALSLGKFLGITSIAGGIGLVVTLYYLMPRLTILEIQNKHAKHSYESRLIVKNIGKLPAYAVSAKVHNIHLVVGNGHKEIRGGSFIGGPTTSRLDANEVMEVPVLPRIGMSPGLPLLTCVYNLELEHKAKLLFYKPIVRRFWRIELRNLGTEFIWQCSPL